MNWPFKVHKLEPSVMLVGETRREREAARERRRGGGRRESRGEKIRHASEKERGEEEEEEGTKIKTRARKTALMSVRDSESSGVGRP